MFCFQQPEKRNKRPEVFLLKIPAFLLLGLNISTKIVMKKAIIIVYIFCFIIVFNSFAQSRIYKSFKVDLGINTIITSDVATGNGMGIYIHPILNVTDRFSFGPRLEIGYVTIDDTDFVSATFENGVVDMFSFQAVSDYYLSKERVRFFLGLGFGLFRQTLLLHDFTSFQIRVDRISEVNLGLNPRFGFNVGHFKMAVNYNLTGEFMYDYLGFTLGVDIGGGRR